MEGDANSHATDSKVQVPDATGRRPPIMFTTIIKKYQQLQDLTKGNKNDRHRHRGRYHYLESNNISEGELCMAQRVKIGLGSTI